MYADESESYPVTGNMFTSSGPQHSTPIKGHRTRNVSTSPVCTQPRGDSVIIYRDVNFSSISPATTESWQSPTPTSTTAWQTPATPTTTWQHAPPKSTTSWQVTSTPKSTPTWQTPPAHVALSNLASEPPQCVTPRMVSLSPAASSNWQSDRSGQSTEGRDQGDSMANPSPAHQDFCQSHTESCSKHASGSSLSSTHRTRGVKQTSSTVDLQKLQNMIDKQRQEIRSLISELKDRDRELNNIVAAQQQQMASWQQDRQKLLAVEKKCWELEEKLTQSTRELKKLQQVLESQVDAKASHVDRTKKQLEKINSEKKQQTMQLESLQELNMSLNNSLKAVSGQVGQLEAREQELVTLLNLKEQDILTKNKTLEELNVRIKQMDTQCHECQHHEADALRKVIHWKEKYMQARDTIEKLMNEAKKKEVEANQSLVKLAEFKSQLLVKEPLKVIIPSSAREKAKDNLVESLKAKREKMLAELHSFDEHEESVCCSTAASMDTVFRRMENLNSHCAVYENNEGEALVEVNEWRQKYMQAMHTVDTLSNELKKKQDQINQSTTTVIEIDKQLALLQESYDATCEREKWKDQLLDSFKCKQDKLSDELNTIRELNVKQKKEMAQLQSNLEHAMETLQCGHHGDHDNLPQYKSRVEGKAEDSGYASNRMSLDNKLPSLLENSANTESTYTTYKDDLSKADSHASKLQFLITEWGELIHSLERKTGLCNLQLDNRDVENVSQYLQQRSASEVFNARQTTSNMSTNSV